MINPSLISRFFLCFGFVALISFQSVSAQDLRDSRRKRNRETQQDRNNTPEPPEAQTPPVTTKPEQPPQVEERVEEMQKAHSDAAKQRIKAKIERLNAEFKRMDADVLRLERQKLKGSLSPEQIQLIDQQIALVAEKRILVDKELELAEKELELHRTESIKSETQIRWKDESGAKMDVDSILKVAEERIRAEIKDPEAREEALEAIAEAREELKSSKITINKSVERKRSSNDSMRENIEMEIRRELRESFIKTAEELEEEADNAKDPQEQEILINIAQQFRRQAERNSSSNSEIIIESEEAVCDTCKTPSAIVIHNDDGVLKILIDTNKKKEKDDGEKKYKIVDTGLASFRMGLNTWTHNGNFNLTGKLNDLELKQPNSIEFHLAVAPTRIRFGHRSKFHMLTEANFLFQNYKFQEPLTLASETKDFRYSIDPDQDYIRNKLAMTYLNVPLLFMFSNNRAQPDRGFRIAAGPYFSYLLSSHTKQREAGERKTKIKDDFNLDRMQYGIEGRIGYRHFELYTLYGMSDLFESESGAPSLRNFSVGIRIL